MNWITIAQLIAQYGIPFVENLWGKVSANSAPTQAEWDELKVLAQQNSQTAMLAALGRAGIDPASSQGKTLLGLA